VAGHGSGSIRSGRHLHLGDKVPITNLYRSLLDRMGVPTEKVGDSTSSIETIG
jgi:hypothetical protein